MYQHLQFNELRGMCRTTIESLEKWLRRLIDDQLRASLGDNYLNFQDEKGNYLIKRKTRENIAMRMSDEPKRYPRDIDAILLDDAMDILLHQSFYNNYFQAALIEAFPDGKDEARTFIRRIIEIRNYLSHANPISIRQAERAICYSNDIIDSLKNFYILKGMQEMYNVPMIIQVTDSKGNCFYDAEINRNRNGTGRAGLNLQNIENSLRPGELLRIEVEIDPSFKENEYEVHWVFEGMKNEQVYTGRELNILIDNSHVREDFAIYCSVTSTLHDWHRLGNCDDSVSLVYRVLPPVG